MSKPDVAAIIRATIVVAFSSAADLVRKKQGSRRDWTSPSDSEETRAHNSATSEAVETALTEVADALDEVSREFAEAQAFARMGSNQIYLSEQPEFGPPRIFVRGSRKWIKHVWCPGVRFHVLSWSTQGQHCSEPDCVVNRRERIR